MSTNELTAKLKVAAKLRIEADSWPGSDGRIARMGVYIETGDDISTANILTLIEALEAAEKRIAELEAREVKLPPNELVTDTWTSPGDGWEVFDAQKVIDSIRSAGVRIAAGISVKGE